MSRKTEELQRYGKLKRTVNASLEHLAKTKGLLLYAGELEKLKEVNDARTGSLVDSVLSLDQKLLDEMEAATKEMETIQEKVEALEDPVLRSVLVCLYIDGMTGEQAAEALGYSSRHLYRLRDQALKQYK